MSDGVKRMDAAHKSAILDRWERANAMVDALCQPHGTAGSREWLMSIPARPDHDPDLIISSALADVPALLDALAAAEGRAAALEAALRRLLGNIATGRPLHNGYSVYYDGHFPDDLIAQARAALADAAPATREE